MNAGLCVLSAGPACQVQDLGRPGWRRFGLPEGGAMDVLAVYENAALLGQPVDRAVIEMGVVGGRFEARGGPLRVALTGAPMRAALDGARVAWNASHLLEPGRVLEIGAAERGVYGYLGVGGGVGVDPWLGSRSTHARAAVGGLDGRALRGGDVLPVGDDPADRVGWSVPARERFDGGALRVLWGPQSCLFAASERARFLKEGYRVGRRADRMGVRLETDAPPLIAEGHLSGASDAVTLGDVQVPGDGAPVVLLADRQTTGGYPRIATVIHADLPRMAQARPGTAVQFTLVSLDEALDALARFRARCAKLARECVPATGSSRDAGGPLARKLLNEQLVSGAVVDERLPWEECE